MRVRGGPSSHPAAASLHVLPARAGALPAELGRCRRMEAFSAFTNRLTAVPGALLAGLVECTRLSAPLWPVVGVWVRVKRGSEVWKNSLMQGAFRQGCMPWNPLSCGPASVLA